MQKEARLNNEKRIENQNFRLKIGTTNKLQPIVVYVEGKAFISPKEEKFDYTKDVSEIRHSFKQSITEGLYKTTLFDNKYILDFQVATSGIKPEKKSFLSFQFYLRQNKDDIKKLPDLKNLAGEFITEVVDSLSDSIYEHGFEITKTKK